jgi:sporulation protein YlmC with PRC-barrel domain
MSETLFKSADIQGLHLAGIDGDRLGTVRELFLDLGSGGIAYLIVESAGLLGGHGKFHPVPWSAVRYDAVAGSFQVEMTKNDFKASPSYDREQLANRDHGWDEQATRYFAATRPS